MYCEKCGYKLPDDAMFCGKCGAPTPSNTKFQQNSWQSQPNQTSNNWNQPNPDQQVNKNTSSKVFRALAYVPFLFWLPLAFEQQDQTGRKCANQGLLLLICNVILSFLNFALVNIFLNGIFHNIWVISSFVSILSTLINIVFGILRLTLIVCMIFGIIKSAQNEYFEIPIIGKITIIK